MKCLRIADDDNVAVAVDDIKRGDSIDIDGKKIEIKSNIDRFHKIAIEDIACYDEIIKYGVSIGISTKDIKSGESVHLHNMKSKYIKTYSWKTKKEHSDRAKDRS